jgi:hypothetical protein
LIAFERAEYIGELLKLLDEAKKTQVVMVGENAIVVPGTMQNIVEVRRIARDFYAAHTEHADNHC